MLRRENPTSSKTNTILWNVSVSNGRYIICRRCAADKYGSPWYFTIIHASHLAVVSLSLEPATECIEPALSGTKLSSNNLWPYSTLVWLSIIESEEAHAAYSTLNCWQFMRITFGSLPKTPAGFFVFIFPLLYVVQVHVGNIKFLIQWNILYRKGFSLQMPWCYKAFRLNQRIAHIVNRTFNLTTLEKGLALTTDLSSLKFCN